MKSFESWILSYLLNSLWQIPLLFVAGWIAARALRMAGAEAEHRVWVSVLLLQSLLPALSTSPWEWLWAHFAWGSGALRDGGAHVSVVMGAGTGLGGFHLPAELLAAVAIVYGAVSAYFAARFVWRWRKLHAIRREAVEVALTGEAALCWAQCSERFGIDGVSIAASSRIFGPVTMGLSRKIVLLPVNMISSLQEADIHAAIAHEFAHMRRNDFFKNVLYELLSLPVSYHPLFWLTRERVMESREIICDQMAAEISGRNQYAQSLLRLASLLVHGMPARTPHAIGIFDANAFERRLMKLTEKQIEIRGSRRLAVVVLCVAFGIMTCGSALALRMHVDAVAAGGGSDAATKSAPLTIPAGEMAGNRLPGPNPKYPEAAKKARIQGTVVLRAWIGKDGSVERLTVVSGPKELQKSSLDAVRQWTYKPYLLNGDPVEVETRINVVYSLAK
ncbi:MAG: M56 family metallopeptidase [Silvibacterium sp.]